MAESKRSIRILLLVLFILSLVSPMIAMTVVGCSVWLSPIPEFDLTMLEHMWKFFLFIPIPLASVVLGVIYKFKGYRCLKNIIAGFIMIPLLCLFGCYIFIFSAKISHDWNYLNEVESIVDFNFPDKGHISIQNDYIVEKGSSMAMVKFDREDADGVVSQLENDPNWNRDISFMPANAIDSFTLAHTSDYEYYTVFNTTTASYNNFPGTLIFMAYDVDSRILFIYRQSATIMMQETAAPEWVLR